jgi:hypothetical protein
MEDTMKTVLAPNAPWPYTATGEVVVKPKPKPLPKPKKPRSKIADTNRKFEEWADKNGLKK